MVHLDMRTDLKRSGGEGERRISVLTIFEQGRFMLNDSTIRQYSVTSFVAVMTRMFD
jgi:hypothetical protein